jgi:hypothetical protein
VSASRGSFFFSASDAQPCTPRRIGGDEGPRKYAEVNVVHGSWRGNARRGKKAAHLEFPKKKIKAGSKSLAQYRMVQSTREKGEWDTGKSHPQKIEDNPDADNSFEAFGALAFANR